MPEYAIYPMPRPGPYPRACQSCEGTGTTGQLFEFETGDPIGSLVILCQELCPQCDGCGNGDPQHRQCPQWLHGAWDPGDDDTGDDDTGAGDGATRPGGRGCLSCHGRGWWTVMAFSTGADDTVRWLRIACGCQHGSLIRLATAQACAEASVAATGNRA